MWRILHCAWGMSATILWLSWNSLQSTAADDLYRQRIWDKRYARTQDIRTQSATFTVIRVYDPVGQSRPSPLLVTSTCQVKSSDRCIDVIYNGREIKRSSRDPTAVHQGGYTGMSPNELILSWADKQFVNRCTKPSKDGMSSFKSGIVIGISRDSTDM
jgi:hypothetical protein